MGKVIQFTRTDAHGRTITKTKRTKAHRPRRNPPGGAAAGRPTKSQFTVAYRKAA